MFTFRQAIFCFVRYAQNRFCIFYGIIPAFFSSRCSVTHHRLPSSSLVLSPTDARVPALPSNATHLSEDPVQPASVSARLTAHALCAIHLADQRAPARRQYSVSMRVALSRAFADMARCVVPGIRRYGALCCPARCCYSAGHRWAYKCLLTQASFMCYSYIITRGYGIPGFFLCAVPLHKGVFHHVLYRCRSRRYQYCHRYR